MDYNESILLESMAEFSQLQTYRAIFAEHWQEVAELVAPVYRNTFYYGNYNFPGLKKTDRQVDATAMLALSRFASILDSLLTPRNMMWHMLGSSTEQVMKSRLARLWFEQTTKLLFKYRYAPIANFSAMNQNIYEGLGAFGNGCMFVDRAVNAAGIPINSFRYKAIHIGEMFLRENHQGLINGFNRWFRLTGQQAVNQFGAKCPEKIRVMAMQSSQMPFDFLHRVCPRSDYDPKRLDAKGKPFASYYISLTTNELVGEGGYRTFPVACSRYIQTPGEVYGRSPAMQGLPSIKTINAQKRDFLTQGHRAASPVLLTADDGIANLSMRPGAQNIGGVNSDGKLLVATLPTGNIQTTLEMMQEEGKIIDGLFLTDLFKVLLGDPKIYTATQIVEMMSQRGILIAPTVGRQQSEYLGPMILRELDLLDQMGVLPPMPGIVREAWRHEEDNKIIYTSPLSRDQRAQEVAGFTRSLETTLSIVNATQDPSPLDVYDWDVIGPEIAQIQGVPESWMASPQKIAAKRDNREKQLAQQQKIQAMPAQAAMMKAKAAAGLPPTQQVQEALPAPGAGQ